MQAGSDGKTACATCHYAAGADARLQNTLGLPQDNPNKVRLRSPISKLKSSDFPFIRVSGNPLSPNGTVYQNLEEIVGSKGVELRQFQNVWRFFDRDQGFIKPDPISAPWTNLRTVTSRNSQAISTPSSTIAITGMDEPASISMESINTGSSIRTPRVLVLFVLLSIGPRCLPR